MNIILAAYYHTILGCGYFIKNKVYETEIRPL